MWYIGIPIDLFRLLINTNLLCLDRCKVMLLSGSYVDF